MFHLDLAGITVGGVAFVLKLLGRLPDNWLFGLLSLAVLLGSASEAYREERATAVSLLLAGAVFAGAAAHAAFTNGRKRTAR